MKAAAVIAVVWGVLLLFAMALFYAAGEDERSRESWQHGSTEDDYWEDQ